MSLRLQEPAGLLALRALGLKAKEALALAAGEGPAPGGINEAWAEAAASVAVSVGHGFSVISYFDVRYPERLRVIKSPPLVLRVWGAVEALSAPMAAVAGTRQPSQFGVSATEAAVSALAAAGVGVVSGLARGVDTVAHRAALAAGVPTVAVLGSGLSRLYPPENAALAAEIAANGGAVVSELADEIAVASHQLIARNRLQTGLALALIVGQTGLKGGTLYTVRFALEQGRPVWCPKPQAAHSRSEGLSILIERPTSELPDLLPAFSSASRLCQDLKQPLARPFSRDDLGAMAAEIAALA